MGAILSASVPITLDGREYVLRYRAHAFITYAETCGGDLIFEIRTLGTRLAGAGAAEGAGLGQICVTLRDVLWAGLVDAQPDIRREEVGRMFGLADLAAITPAITAALQKTMPEADPTGAAVNPASASARPLASSPRANGPDYGPSIVTDAELQPANSVL
jgi:hypothetical protein